MKIYFWIKIYIFDLKKKKKNWELGATLVLECTQQRPIIFLIFSIVGGYERTNLFTKVR